MEKVSLQTQLENILKKNLNDIKELDVKTEDACCGGNGIEIFVVSDDFKNIGFLDRNRKIRELLEQENISFHKIVIKTFTEEENNKRKNK